MKRPLLSLTVLLLSCCGTLQAEITVSSRNGDLVISTEQPSDWDELMMEYEQGYFVDVTEVNGMVQVRSSTDVTVNGQQSVQFPFPQDDIVIDVHPWTQNAGVLVAVHSLSLAGQGDDLRVSTSGYCYVVNVSTGNNSHSDMRLRGGNTVEVDGVWVQRELQIDGSWKFHMEMTGVGGTVFVDCRKTAKFSNNWLGGDLWLYMSNYSNTVEFRDYIQIDGDTSIHLDGGNDFVEISMTEFSTLGTARLEGGHGTDTVYQDRLVFTAGNTKSIEYFK